MKIESLRSPSLRATLRQLFVYQFASGKGLAFPELEKGAGRGLEWIEIDMMQLQLAMALCVNYYQGVFFFLVQLLHVPTLRAVFLL